MAKGDPRVPNASLTEKQVASIVRCLDRLQEGTGEYIDMLLIHLVRVQPSVVMSLKRPALSALKAEVGLARDRAIASAGNILHEPDLEAAATAALGYATEGQMVDLNGRLDQILAPVLSVLTRGGFHANELSSTMPQADRRKRLNRYFRNALREYGEAALGLRPVSSENAWSAWESA